MIEFIDEIRQNPLALAVGAILLVIGIVLLHNRVSKPTTVSPTASPAIDPNTGLPYPPSPSTINNFTSYPIIGTQPAPASNYLAYTRARFSSPNVKSYDTTFEQGVPIRDLSGKVIGYSPYGQSVNVTGNPIAGSSNLPGTQSGTTQWLPVKQGNVTGYVSSFDLTGLQQGATLDTSQQLSLGAGGLPSPNPTHPVPTPPVKVSSPTYVTAEHWPSQNSTLSGIASSHGISLSKIEMLNPQIKNPNLIYAGQSIRIS